jgi:hypothetical protein
MSDSYTETTTQGWFSRIGDSIKGILFGFIAIPAMVILLWWNEGRAVTTAKSLAEGAAAVVSVSAEKVDAANDKKLVHVIGEAKAAAEIEEPDFGFKTEALKLLRKVEIYQWVESKKEEKTQNVGGSEETKTTYTYEKEWTQEPVDSSKFKKPDGHENKGELVVDGGVLLAEDVTLGAFAMPKDLLERLGGEEKLNVKAADLPEDVREKVEETKDGFFFGEDAAKPKIGDQRVSFEVVRPGTVSVLAAQVKDTFEPYATKAGDDIIMIQTGTASAEAMFQSAAATNSFITWLVRFVGFLFMFFGFLAIVGPLKVLGSVIPLLGDIIGAGSGLICFILAAVLSLLVIAIAWLAARPLVGIVLLGLVVFAVMQLRKMAAKSKAAAAPAAAA